MGAPTNPPEHRKHDRTAVLFAARLLAGDVDIGCDITNISFGGAQIHVRKTLARGEVVVLDIDPFGKYEVEVRWVDGHDAGVKFKEDPTRVGELVMAIATYA